MNNNPTRVYGTSTLTHGVLTYRGRFISPDIDKELITSIIFAEDVEFVDEGIDTSDPDDEIQEESQISASGVFSECVFLETVVINSRCALIGAFAFYECSSLRTIVMKNGSCERIEESAFFKCDLQILNIPESCRFIGRESFGACPVLEKVIFAGSHMTELGEACFCSNIALTSIYLPLVPSIPEHCLADCLNLKTLIVPSTCKSIEHQALFGCRSLDNVVLPDTCIDLDHPFSSCDLLEAAAEEKNLTVEGLLRDRYRLLDDAASKLNITVEQLIRYRKRLPKFIIPAFLAFRRCDMLKGRTGSDGIGLNEEGDIMVLMYRKIESEDLWRNVLGYMCPLSLLEGGVDDDGETDSDSESESENENENEN